MGPIEEALREKFFPPLCRGEEINAKFWKILSHSVKYGGLGIPEPRFSADSAYNTSKVASGELVDFLLGASALNYIGHRACVRGESARVRKERNHMNLAEVDRQKELAGGQKRNRIHKATRTRAWLSAVPHRLNGT